MAVEGISTLVKNFWRRSKSTKPRFDIRVGYTAEYAIYVHENIHANFRVGQAKFLEQPARELADQLITIVNRNMKLGDNLEDAMYKAGVFLKEESQKLCPVDTGFLKASAYVAREGPA